MLYAYCKVKLREYTAAVVRPDKEEGIGVTRYPLKVLRGREARLRLR